MYPRRPKPGSPELNQTSVIARVAQSTTLVVGGGNTSFPYLTDQGLSNNTFEVVAGIGYELVGRPFDVMRREWHIYTVTHPYPRTLADVTTDHPRPDHILSAPRLALHILKEQGLRGLFRSPLPHPHPPAEPNQDRWKRRVYPVLRTIARVGPWGVGFLVWEAFGTGIQ